MDTGASFNCIFKHVPIVLQLFLLFHSILNCDLLNAERLANWNLLGTIE